MVMLKALRITIAAAAMLSLTTITAAQNQAFTAWMWQNFPIAGMKKVPDRSLLRKVATFQRDPVVAPAGTDLRVDCALCPPSPPLVRKRLGEAVPLLCLAPCRSSVSHTTVISHGAGGGISTNRIDSQSTNVDTEDVGNAPISYNCRRIRDGGGFIPQG